MRQFAVMADIHSNYPNFQLVLDYIKEHFPFILEYIFLGDYILNGFEGNEVLNQIKSLSSIVIAGNKEEFFQNGITPAQYQLHQWRDLVYTDQILSEENREYISHLENTKIIDVEGVKILLCHGAPNDARGKIYKDDYSKFDELIEKYPCDVYFFAHTHKHFEVYYKNKLFINAGSVGMPLSFERKADFGILSIDQQNVSYQSFSIPYDYEFLEKYFKESDFYKTVGCFAEILLMNLKDNIDYTEEAMKFVFEKAKFLDLDTTDGIPNEVWDSAFEEFKKIRHLDRFV